MIAALLKWTGLSQWMMELIALAAVAAGVSAYLHHVYDKGMAAQQAVQAKQAAEQTAAAQKVADAAEHSHDQELADLRAYRAAHPVDFSVCIPSTVRPTSKAGSVSHSASPAAGSVQSVPAGDSGVQPVSSGRPIGPMLDALAASADAVSAQVRTYQKVTK